MLFGIVAWTVGLLLVVAGLVVGLLGLGAKVPLGPWLEDTGNGLIQVELPSPREAREQQTALLRKLRLSQAGIVLATAGGVLSAVGTQPWAG